MRSIGVAVLLAAGCASSSTRWAFDLDQEEGVHGNVQVEWWYHWGFLKDEAGGEWCCFSSFFRTSKLGLPVTRYFIYDLTDLKTGQRVYRSAAGSEILALAALQTGVAKFPPPHEAIPGTPLEKPGDPLRLQYGSERVERTGPREYRLQVGEIDLSLKSVAEAMAVEGTGLTGIQSPEGMHYYSLPRLEAKGTVRGKKATGIFWYDHQWGGEWTEPVFGWSWWGLQLDDGSNVNAYVLRDLKSGKLIRAVCTHDREVYPLEATPRETWKSPTGVSYPISWTLKAGPLALEVEPLYKERESPILGEQGSIWEGPVRVSGSLKGRGFQELVSYAREQRGK